MITVAAKRLGLEVRRRRLQRGMTQQQLALKVGIRPSYISKIESGILDPEKQGPGESVVRSLAENLAMEGESVDDLTSFFMTACLGKLPKTVEQEVVNSIRASMERQAEVDSDVPRRSSARALLRHAGKWMGDDLEQCLKAVYSARSKAEF